MSKLMDDLRLAWRGLRRSPVFTGVVVTTLALAIGANAAVFGLVDAVLLTPPLPDAERIVRLWEERPSRGWTRFGVSGPTFNDWQSETRAFERMAAYTRRSANFAGSEEPQRVDVIDSTADLAQVLGVRARMGRFYGQEEQARGRGAVAVLSDEFWRAAFAARPDTVGRTILLDGVPHVVVGIVPREATAVFEGAQVFRPLSLEGDDQRGARWLEVIARLAPGVAREQAAAELSLVARRHERDHPETNTGWTASLAELQEVRTEGTRPVLLALWAAVSLVLLVASANVAGLMFVRAGDREGELAVRAALGAPPGRLARLVLTEGLVLALLSGAVGSMAALAVRAVLALFLESAVGPLPPLRLDGRVAVFVALATLGAGLAFALGPSLRVRRIRLEPGLRAGGRGSTRSRSRVRRALAAAEIAAAVVLLAGTGLLMRSVHGLLAVSPGFDPAGALVVRVAPAQSKPAVGQSEEDFVRSYLAERDRIATFYDGLLERVRGLPGVNGAGAINRLPLTGRWWSISVAADDRPTAPGDTPSAAGRVATPGYFEAMRIPLRSGRGFTGRDHAAAPAVVVVSESLARRSWPGQDPIGRRLAVDERPGLTVIGVAGDVRVEGLDLAAPPIVYVPFAQATFGLFPDWGLDVVVRSTGDPAVLAGALRNEVARLDPALPVFAVRTMDDVLGGWMARRRAVMVLFASFAVLALVLAAVGLYGVVSQSARERTREIGVRVALGATPQDIARLVVREGLVLAVIGAGCGLVAAASGGRVLSSFLFGVTPADPLTLLATAAALAVVAIATAAVPARRAARLDPVVALHYE